MIPLYEYFACRLPSKNHLFYSRNQPASRRADLTRRDDRFAACEAHERQLGGTHRVVLNESNISSLLHHPYGVCSHTFLILAEPARELCMSNEWYETLKDLTAGTIGGCGGIVVGQPLDTVKVRLQAQGSSGATSGLHYSGPIDALIKMVRYEGPQSLFKGLMPPLLGNAPMNAIAFGAYGNASRILEPYYPNTPPVRGAVLARNPQVRDAIPEKQRVQLLNEIREKYSSTVTMEQLERNSVLNSDIYTPNFTRLFAAGCWSGLLQSFATTPAELLKCKLQAQQEGARLYNGMWDCAVKMCKQKGVRLGLYTGFWSTVWRDMPGMGAYFVAYEGAKWFFRTETYKPVVTPREPTSSSTNDLPISVEWKHDVSYSTLGLLAAGGVAGIATWVATYPFDCIKSVVQTLPDDAPKKEFTMRHIAVTNYQKFGLSFFFRGLGTTLIRAVPVNAATFWLYEESLKLFKYLENRNSGVASKANT